MNCKININMDGAAFWGEYGQINGNELSRIFNELSCFYKDYEFSYEMGFPAKRLLDSNGNKCGTFTITE